MRTVAAVIKTIKSPPFRKPWSKKKNNVKKHVK